VSDAALDLLERPSIEVAPLLLGGILTVDGVSLRITEVEAYLGELDPGSHAFRGKGNRNAVMYGPPGHLYTYFTYGMHTCANVVTSPEGTASAVLLRAGEIVEGLEDARARRPTSRSDHDLAQGPARLCVALGIRLADNGAQLAGRVAPPQATGPTAPSGRGSIETSPRFQLTLPEQPATFTQGPRTGVSGPGGTDAYPWRFWIPGERSVSPYKRHVPKKR
jgi:DNA-3-methyladenine glycosylase